MNSDNKSSPHPREQPAGSPNIRIIKLAEKIIREIRPSSVLDACCVGGELMAQLRGHGVEAWGMASSEDALQSIRPDMQPYCWLGSLVDPLPRRYDLIICLDIVENLNLDQAERAIQNLCQYSDDILFTPTSPNAQNRNFPYIYGIDNWVTLFAQHHYIHDFDFDTGFNEPLVIRFRKVQQPLPFVLTAYERRLQQLMLENRARHELNILHRSELMEKESGIKQREAHFQELSKRISQNEAEIRTLHRQLVEKENNINDILNSRSWRLIRRAQQLRHRLIPLDSRREQAMFFVLYSLEILRREGLISFSKRVAGKLSSLLRMSLMKARLRMRLAPALSARLAGVEPVQPTPQIMPHQVSVDIIVCVHNALSDVKGCLESVIRYTNLPYRLILVDDGSDQATQMYLDEFSYLQGAVLFRNDHATGYTRAANRGLKESSADYAVLLNSDTIVTPRWLDRLIACAESEEHIGMVGPLSNTASWQSIPEIFNDDGDWADNDLPSPMTARDMAARIAQYSACLYPRLPFLNGFCLLIKRALIQQIGYFDDSTFGDGYGEENDYCLRAQQAGWQIAVADDVYVYHAQSRSYSHRRRLELVQRSDRALVSKYGHQLMSNNAERCRDDRVMNGIRARAQVMSQREELREKGKQLWEGQRILFVLPIADPGGGGNVVIQESEAMQCMGIDVNIANLLIHRSSFERWYPDLKLPSIFVQEPRLSSSLLSRYDAILATVFHSVEWMDVGTDIARSLVRGYYIQDFEPDFFPQDSSYYKSAYESYTRFSDLVRMTKTEWNRELIKKRIGVDCSVVGPSVDIDLFRPRRRKDADWPHRPLRIAAMIRPKTPRRQPELTMQVLKEISHQHRGAIEIILFGCQAEDPAFYKLQTDFPWQNAGILTRQQLAFLLNEVDIFVDFSAFQAMGLTAMEAMACGAAVVVPQRGGAGSFARNEENALVVDTSSPEACLSVLNRLLGDEQLRNHIQRQAILDICQQFPERAAFNILNTLFTSQFTA
jgi:GT2 family glycosyltransferase/glycosyltransferase involved in cell wall biosynthesis